MVRAPGKFGLGFNEIRLIFLLDAIRLDDGARAHLNYSTIKHQTHRIPVTLRVVASSIPAGAAHHATPRDTTPPTLHSTAQHTTAQHTTPHHTTASDLKNEAALGGRALADKKVP